MGLMKVIRNVNRIKKMKKEIQTAKAKNEDIKSLMLKRYFIAKELRDDVHKEIENNPLLMTSSTKIGGLNIGDVDKLFNTIENESKAYGIKVN